MHKNYTGCFLLLIGLFSIATSDAQIEKGDWLTGGAIYYSTSQTETNTAGVIFETQSANFNINAFGAYFILNKLAVGAGIGWAQVKNTNNYEPLEVTDINSTLQLEAMSRYYFIDGDVFDLWTGLGARFGFGNYTDNFVELDENGNYIIEHSTDKLNTINIGIGPGAALQLTPKLSLDVYLGSIGYSIAKFDSKTIPYTYKNETFGFSFAQNFGFGITCRL